MARRRIEVEIIGNPRSLQGALGKSSAALSTFSKRMSAIGSQMTTTGRTAFRGLTLPIVGIGAAAVKMGLDFEESMTHIRALVGASDSQMKGYRDGVLDLAKTLPQGPQELADALYFVTSAGFEGASAMRVLTASAQAAAAGLGDTATVADVVTSAVNVYGEKALSASRATDILLATVREGKAEPAELAQALGAVIAPAEAVGVTFDEVGGAVAGLTLGGLDAAKAVTGLRGILSTLLKPSSQAQEVLGKVGLKMSDIRRQVDRNGLLPTLQKLRDRFAGNKEALAKLFPNVRALNAFLALTGRNAKKNTAAMKGVQGSVGDTGKALAKASKDDLFKFRVAWSNLRVAMIQASDSILPVVTQIVGVISKVAGSFDKLSPSTKRMIIGFALVAAAVGPILLSVGALIAVIAFLASTVGIVVVALIALGAAIVYLWTQHEGFRQAVLTAWTAIQAAAAAVVAWYQGTLAPTIASVIGTLQGLWARFGGALTAIARGALAVLQGIITTAFATIKGIVEAFLAVLRGDWGAAWGALKSIVRAQINGAIAIVRGLQGILVGILRAMGAAIVGLAGEFYGWGKALGTSLKDGILGALSGIASAIESAITSHLPGGGFSLSDLVDRHGRALGGVGFDAAITTSSPIGGDYAGGSSGALAPRALGGAGGGERLEFVVTNWHEGTGYIRSVADGAVAGAARLSGQRTRMGAGV